jgi:exosortase
MFSLFRFNSCSSPGAKGLNTETVSCRPEKRLVLAGAFLLLGLAVFSGTAIGLLNAKTDYYSHIPAIYCIIGYILISERKIIFSNVAYSPLPGMGLIALSIIIYFYGRSQESILSLNDYASVEALSFAVYLAGIFLCFFGLNTFKMAKFAVFLLILTIPIPDFMLDKIVLFLQIQSYNAACWVLDAVGLYPLKEGFLIILPDLTAEVAKQCSGIRSSIALLIVSILYGRYFLRTRPAMVLLVVLTMFIAPFKNGLRIATLIFLGVHWDKKILAGSLHQAGGIPFFFIGLLWLSLVLLLLVKSEKFVLKRYSQRSSGPA